MQDARLAQRVAHAGHLGVTVQQRLGQRGALGALERVRGQATRLVHHHHVLVLEQHLERQLGVRLGGEVGRFGCLLEAHLRAAREPVALLRAAPVDAHLPGTRQLGGERTRHVRHVLHQEEVEAQALCARGHRVQLVGRVGAHAARG
jgi:hypothetical protein